MGNVVPCIYQSVCPFIDPTLIMALQSTIFNESHLITFDTAIDPSWSIN